MRHLTLWLLLLVACGEENPPQAPPQAPSRPPDFVDFLNEYRRAAGVATVSRDEVLARAAAAHAAEMERLWYHGHFSPTPGNRTPDDRLAQAGWPAGRRYYELLAHVDSAKKALETWKAKPAYDRALLDPDLGVAGVARRGRTWVLLLGMSATAGKQGTVTER